MGETGRVNAQHFISLAVALGVGFLIGLQREQSTSRTDEQRSSLGGVRTYPLVALAGAVAMLLAGKYGGWLVGAGVVALLVPMGLAYADDLRRERDRGITSEVAMLLTYLLGCLATADGIAGSWKERLLLSSSAAVAVTALLSYKESLHSFAARVSRDDIYAIVKFGILALIVLPLLPDKGYGPYQALNPFKIGLLVVLIAGVSFCGYVAVRLLGPGKGLGLTGLLGGLASSTAITLSFSGRAKREPQAATACALGVVLASTVMGLRMIVLVAVVNRSLLEAVVLPLGALAAAGALAAGVIFSKSRKENVGAESVQFSNPFEISSALKFGLLFAAVLVASKWATHTFGAQGSYLAALLAGSTDVDAVTLSLARMGPQELLPAKAALAIFLAAVANTAVKGGIAVVVGGWAYAWRVVASFGAMIAAGVAAVSVLLLRS